MKVTLNVRIGTDVPELFVKAMINASSIILCRQFIYQQSVQNAMEAVWMWINLHLLPTPYIM